MQFLICDRYKNSFWNQNSVDVDMDTKQLVLSQKHASLTSERLIQINDLCEAHLKQLAAELLAPCLKMANTYLNLVNLENSLMYRCSSNGDFELNFTVQRYFSELKGKANRILEANGMVPVNDISGKMRVIQKEQRLLLQSSENSYLVNKDSFRCSFESLLHALGESKGDSQPEMATDLSDGALKKCISAIDFTTINFTQAMELYLFADKYASRDLTRLIRNYFFDLDPAKVYLNAGNLHTFLKLVTLMKVELEAMSQTAHIVEIHKSVQAKMSAIFVIACLKALNEIVLKGVKETCEDNFNANQIDFIILLSKNLLSAEGDNLMQVLYRDIAILPEALIDLSYELIKHHSKNFTQKTFVVYLSRCLLLTVFSSYYKNFSFPESNEKNAAFYLKNINNYLILLEGNTVDATFIIKILKDELTFLELYHKNASIILESVAGDLLQIKKLKLQGNAYNEFANGIRLIKSPVFKNLSFMTRDLSYLDQHSLVRLVQTQPTLEAVNSTLGMLTLDGCYFSNNSSFNNILKSMPNLEFIRLSNFEISLFEIDSIKFNTITTLSIKQFELPRYIIEVLRTMPNLKYLYLNIVKKPKLDLKEIINACPNLQIFSINWLSSNEKSKLKALYSNLEIINDGYFGLMNLKNEEKFKDDACIDFLADPF